MVDAIEKRGDISSKYPRLLPAPDQFINTVCRGDG